MQSLEQIEQQQREIEDEVKKSPLLTAKQPLISVLESYNAESENVQNKVKHLGQTYSQIRLVRGDGNCFYRSFSFGLLEYLLQLSNQTKEAECKRITNIILQNKKHCVELLGYEEYLVEDFYFSLLEAVEAIQKNEVKTVKDLELYYTNETTQIYESIVCALRFICSVHMQCNADQFEVFVLDQSPSLQDYCKREVEVMYREAGDVEIMALTSEFLIGVQIEYLDSKQNNTHTIKFPYDSTPHIYLLFKPGHYDLLYNTL